MHEERASRRSPVLRARYLGIVASVALVYFGAAKFGLSLAFATKQVTALWPPTGVAVAALLSFGFRFAPAVFLGAFLVNLTSDEPALTALGIAVGNTLGPLAAVFLLRKYFAFDTALATVRDALGLCICGALGMLITASGGVANLALAGIIPWSAYGSVWRVWWIGDTMGVLVVAPLVLAWTSQRRVARTCARLGELAFLMCGVVLLGLFVLNGSFADAGARLQQQYALFPLIIWGALRFGPRETSAIVALIVGLAVWGAVHDRGPFATGNLDERLVLLELFMTAVVLTGLSLGAATSERKLAHAALEEARNKLEVRVQERTRELALANVELAKKNEEVEAFVYIVSHDLRAPLVNLQGFSKELDLSCRDLEKALQVDAVPTEIRQEVDAIVSDGIRGALKYISASATKFQRLIDALLSLSRTGRQEYRAEVVDVQALIRSTIDSLKQSIEASGAQVSVQPLPGAVGDATALGQVFSNLIVNAVKYLEPGRRGLIEVGAEHGTESTLAHYWVRDNGAGIPASARQRLFQVFQRFHPELAQGEGMGLATVKRIVERHGGSIWAEGAEGTGTTFHLTLPASHLTKGPSDERA